MAVNIAASSTHRAGCVSGTSCRAAIFIQGVICAIQVSGGKSQGAVAFSQLCRQCRHFLFGALVRLFQTQMGWFGGGL